MERLISAVIPAYSTIDIVRNSVVSLVTQWIPDDTFRLEIIIVNDNPDRDYSYFVSEGFTTIANHNTCIGIINNKENYGQGISRQIGIDNATSNWILLCDEDDMYAPNAVYRIWEILNKEHCAGENGLPVAMIAAPIYTFDENEQEKMIESNSIWVNGKLYNRQFLRDNQITFPTGKNSHRAEDYPFSKMVEYAIGNNTLYKRIDIDNTANTFYYWIPNKKSRTRIDKFYTALLTPFTMKSSCIIWEYKKWFNNLHNIEQDKDEEMKHDILNMCVYAYFNYISWLRDMAAGWKDNEKCLEEDWELYKTTLKTLRTELQFYWNEIVPSDIFSMLTYVKDKSDIHFIESWIGSFEDWVVKGHNTMEMSFMDIKKYCGKLKFDDANHELNSPYVKAWLERHKLK